MSEKSMIIPAIFDDCEAIQVVNGVPALVINDKDGTNNFSNVPTSEFIRRTGVSLRLLENLDTLLGVPLYWMNVGPDTGDPEHAFSHRFLCNPTLLSCYQADPDANSIIAFGMHVESGPGDTAYSFMVTLSYLKPTEYNPEGLVSLLYT